MRHLKSALLILAVVVVVHLDWHLARSPDHHGGFSLAWGPHWLLAALEFAGLGWVVARTWPVRRWYHAAWVVGLGLLIAQGVEPVIEVALYARRLGYPDDPARWAAFARCLIAGLPAFGVALGLAQRRPPSASRSFLRRSPARQIAARGTGPHTSACIPQQPLLLRGVSMPTAQQSRALSVVLTVVGLIFVFGIYPLTRVWPSGWSWEPDQPAYLQMILGIYATLGVFLLRAAKAPGEHLSLIWFTVWSSVVHSGIMVWHSFSDAGMRTHLWGDDAALLVVAVVLGLVALPFRGVPRPA